MKFKDCKDYKKCEDGTGTIYKFYKYIPNEEVR